MKALLTLGRMPKGLEVARGLAAAGCEVMVADPHRTHVARHSNAVSRSFRVTAPATSPDGFVEDLLRIVREERVDLVVPVSEESVHVARMVDHLPEGVRFFGAGFQTARALHDTSERRRGPFVASARLYPVRTRLSDNACRNP